MPLLGCRLSEGGICARTPPTNPMVSSINQIACLQFARKLVVWTDDKWVQVHFGNESKFNLIGSDGKKYVRRRLGDRLSPR